MSIYTIAVIALNINLVLGLLYWFKSLELKRTQRENDTGKMIVEGLSQAVVKEHGMDEYRRLLALAGFELKAGCSLEKTLTDC